MKPNNDVQMYVVYHNGPKGDERAFFFKGKTWNSKCTTNFDQAFKTDSMDTACVVAIGINAAAKDAEHPLAGQIKVGQLTVKPVFTAM